MIVRGIISCLLGVMLASSTPQPTVAAALKSYPAASLGYVYSECKEALNLTSYKDFENSYCGKYSNGYMSGLLWSNWIIPVTSAEPCGERESLELKKIIMNDQFEKLDVLLPNLPYGLQFIMAIGNSIPADDPRMDETLSDKTREFLSSSKIEDIIKSQSLNYKDSLLAKNIDAKSIKKDFKSPSIPIEQAYSECKNDIISAHNDSDLFAGTLCGAEMEGLISGLLFNYSFVQTQIHAIKTSNVRNQCDQTALDIYENIDVARRACISPETRGIDIARIFIGLIENKWQYPSNEEDQKKFLELKVGGVATAPYLVSYHGYMCNQIKTGIFQFHRE